MYFDICNALFGQVGLFLFAVSGREPVLVHTSSSGIEVQVGKVSNTSTSKHLNQLKALLGQRKWFCHLFSVGLWSM